MRSSQEPNMSHKYFLHAGLLFLDSVYQKCHSWSYLVLARRSSILRLLTAMKVIIFNSEHTIQYQLSSLFRTGIQEVRLSHDPNFSGEAIRNSLQSDFAYCRPVGVCKISGR